MAIKLHAIVSIFKHFVNEWSKGSVRFRTLKPCTHDQICIRMQILHMQNLRTYAKMAMCTHLLTYAKFACMQKLENLHLPQTKCKSHFAYMQNLRICKSGHVIRKQNLHT